MREDHTVSEPRTARRPGSPEDLVRALRAHGIRDHHVIAAFRAIPRARFVPPAAAHWHTWTSPSASPTGR